MTCPWRVPRAVACVVIVAELVGASTGVGYRMVQEQALLNILASHNMKEERVLYPSIDQVTTPEECQEVFQKMKEIPEDRYRVCCGVQEK